MNTKKMDKDKQTATGTAKSIFSKGLRRTLFLWFLVLALVPVMVASIFSYFTAHNSLKQGVKNALMSVSKMKTEYIRANFDRMLTDLQQQSAMKPNVQFLEKLRSAYKESGNPLDAFVKSFSWTKIADEHGTDLRNYCRTYGYHDIFLIDKQGNILFTVAIEDDFGINLFSGRYSQTLFSRACKKVLETGRFTFSDFEVYSPSDNIASGFLVSVIVNEDGDKIGLMAFQVQEELIDSITQKSTGLGQTAETYLIGADLKMRSNSNLVAEKTILKKSVETEQTLLWRKEHTKAESEQDQMDEAAFLYTGPHGKQVLGVHSNIHIAGVSMAVIAEIEESEAFILAKQLRAIVAALLIVTGVIVFLVANFITKRMVQPILTLSWGAKRVAAGQFDQEIQVDSENEIGELAQSFNNMLQNLSRMTAENEKQDWFKTGQAQLNDLMRGKQSVANISRSIITSLAEYLNAQIGAIYLANDNNHLSLVGSYAYTRRKNLSNAFAFGEGLVGQAALEKKTITLTNVPDDYIAVTSGLGEAVPDNIIVLPFLRDNEVKGVIELGSLYEFSDRNLDFLNRVSENIAIAIHSVQSSQQTQALLEKTQAQSEELQSQQEELRQSNEELEEQTEALKESEAGLQARQEELQQTNEELEEQTQLLEEQKMNIKQKNMELETSRSFIKEKAKDLEISGKYKSEFLANMSHELRTPLNSILLLSKLLSDNKDHNLTGKQVEFAQTIQGSGSDLLNLINEILDLSKVESGKMKLHLEDVSLQDIADTMKQNFKSVARENKLNLNIDVAQDLPTQISTDQQRLDQVVKNLLSNAFKFTDKGSVTLNIGRPEKGVDFSKNGLDPEKTVAFSISDTGIGIAEENRKVIFEAFQQADGTISRNYGGTGLGLSISRELAKFLDGELHLESKEGKGSTFTLYIPETLDGVQKAESRREKGEEGTRRLKTGNEERLISNKKLERGKFQVSNKEFIPDDRKEVSAKDKSILIIEDDSKFARILRDLSREKGFKVLVAENGETGLHFADYYRPCAIILDVGLPGMDGWAVMSGLKKNPKTRHIPVHFISALDKSHDAMKMGAIGYLTKPVSMEKVEQAYEKIEHMISSPIKKLLVVEDDKAQRKAVAELVGSKDVLVTGVSTGREANELLTTENFDCMILDLSLPDMSGIELLSMMKNEDAFLYMPVIVYTGKELTKKEKAILDEYAESIIIKDAKFPERLLDETTLFLHSVEENLTEEKRKMLRMIHDKESILKDKKVLLVDDDMRNVFALTNILEDKGIKVLVGKNGKEAIEHLNKNPDLDLALMDIMMPEMDGYEATGKIRNQERFKNLPIIALTAKAMKGDRAKCIEAGANDYLAKPVDTNKLISMLRVWLY